MVANKVKLTKKEVAQKLGVSVSSLYYKAKRESIDLEVKGLIETIMDSNPDYGHKRIALALKMNKKRILRVMKKYNLKPYRRRRKGLIKKKDINKPNSKYQNLIKDIAVVDKPNLVWASDFTYLKWQGRFLYLSTIIDIYGRNIVGFNLSNRHNKELVLGALENALTSNPKPSILHSDQGSEYDSQVYLGFCQTIGINISMSNKSSPWENSYQESFYSHFKVQLADINRFYDIAELIEEISKLIWYHNNERIHSVLKCPPKMYLESYYKKMGT
ncbi:hypothetical protein COY29_05560 [Candidatus Woesebacteria bacterium CG_4_10_14_0_2_um_filter_39_14]|uniref:Integrase catalytic domain-containing protein n=2 Tax=Candidatus Woeseibacteriota TaxID=1752722 RepID=A0A2M7TK94_9BACT|nr:MAG: hypothetical protein COY29_05560 [Candidatus Woesebacteria bacterium CG_4_10_14_0_2_um_filter_39_14]